MIAFSHQSPPGGPPNQRAKTVSHIRRDFHFKVPKNGLRRGQWSLVNDSVETASAMAWFPQGQWPYFVNL
jgi:hypothetical protein